LSTTLSAAGCDTGWENEAVDPGMIQYSVHAVLSVCHTRCMLNSKYAVLTVNSYSWHREIVSDDLTSCVQVMVELKTRMRKQRGYWGKDDEKLRLKRISGASQFTIPDMACTTSNMLCNYTDTRCSQPTQAGQTPDFSYPLISSTLFSCSSPISLFLIYNSIIMAEP
jgi:hypothetical protein